MTRIIPLESKVNNQVNRVLKFKLPNNHNVLTLVMRIRKIFSPNPIPVPSKF
jgi:hypothetical protein